MDALIASRESMKEHWNRIWAPDQKPVIAQTFPEKLLLGLLVICTFLSARGFFTRWSFRALAATDIYHLLLAIFVLALLLWPTPPNAILAGGLLIYILYEVISWTLFDLFYLVHFDNIYGVRTTVRSFIWAAYSYVIIIWTYGLYYWSTKMVLNAAGRELQDGLEGVYFSAITIATVGYGDYAPSSGQRFLQMIVATEPFVGLLLVGAYIALLISIHASSVRGNFH